MSQATQRRWVRKRIPAEIPTFRQALTMRERPTFVRTNPGGVVHYFDCLTFETGWGFCDCPPVLNREID